MLDPQGTFCRYWDVLIFLGLIFCALVTPYEVVFTETEFGFMFIVNRLVDVIFISDLGLNFVRPAVVKEADGTQKTLNTYGQVARAYLRGWFSIDLVSIIPFDLLGFFVQSGEISRLKVVRLVRLLRLLKLLRILRASRMLENFQNRVAISYSKLALVKFLILLVVTAHFMACMFGLLGLTLAEKAYECQTDDLGDRYAVWNKAVLNMTQPGSWSWVVALFEPGGKSSPDTVCEPGHVYAASLHFSVMTITSIGYGDIVPTRVEEYWVVNMFQILGGCCWAYIIGSACGVVANMDPYRLEFEQTMDALNYMMADRNLDSDLRVRLRQYVRASTHIRHLRGYNAILDDLSTTLQGEVLSATTQKLIKQVWYLRDCSVEFHDRLSRELVPKLFAAQEHVRVPEQGLYIIDRGLVARGGKVLVPGQIWGEDMLLSPVMQDEYRTNAIALTFVEVLILYKTSVYEVVDRVHGRPIGEVGTHSTDAQKIRKGVVTMAVCTSITQLYEAIRHLPRDSPVFQVTMGTAMQCYTRAQQRVRYEMLHGEPAPEVMSAEAYHAVTNTSFHVSHHNCMAPVNHATGLGASKENKVVTALMPRLDQQQDLLLQRIQELDATLARRLDAMEGRLAALPLSQGASGPRMQQCVDQGFSTVQNA
mmetsp:Transcript_126002/g.288412  ORF Transcript_126002/g.288412 Transcript_126002/m.288412 type:complete len:649 (+) Transcript_126002:3-1949(+)